VPGDRVVRARHLVRRLKHAEPDALVTAMDLGVEGSIRARGRRGSLSLSGGGAASHRRRGGRRRRRGGRREESERRREVGGAEESERHAGAVVKFSWRLDSCGAWC
jgi:hypothetical protein